MPIRMEDDPVGPLDTSNDNDNYPQRPPGNSGGGGGGIFSLLPLLLSLFRGKGLLFLLLVGGGLYLFSRSGACNSGGGGLFNTISELTTGGFLDPRQFEKASIYEPLAEDNSRNPLPEAANLQAYAPPVGNQGKQGSCVAWSSAYGARSILEAARTGQKQTTFSPAFLYNQIGLQECEGSYILRAMEYMTKQGAVPYEEFPYDETDCSRQPDMNLVREASNYRMRGFNRLSLGDRNDAIDMRAIRENLAQGAPVVIGMMVGQSFMQDMMGKDLWVPGPQDRGMMGFGGHAMCVVGYDDRKYGGAFLLMNSWGPEWGSNGFAWVRYPEFNYFVREAYGLEPMARTGQAAAAPLQCEIGLVNVAVNSENKMMSTGYISLNRIDSNLYRTSSAILPGSKFKVEVKNNSECYIYIFGMETDGSAYTLFPYPRKEDPSQTKYSPFCGITGYRLFPRDKSMTPDSIGTRDRVAVLVSRQAIDWYALQNAVNKQPGTLPWTDRIRTAIPGNVAKNVSFSSTGKGNILFSAPANNDEVVYCIVEFDKKK